MILFVQVIKHAGLPAGAFFIHIKRKVFVSRLEYGPPGGKVPTEDFILWIDIQHQRAPAINVMDSRTHHKLYLLSAKNAVIQIHLSSGIRKPA